MSGFSSWFSQQNQSVPTAPDTSSWQSVDWDDPDALASVAPPVVLEPVLTYSPAANPAVEKPYSTLPPQHLLRIPLMTLLDQHIQDRIKNVQSSPDYNTLFDVIKQRSFKTGDFVLASGQRSNIYLDLRTTTLSAKGSVKVGRLIWQLIEPLNVEAVAGMTMGADPIVSSVVFASQLQPAANGKSIDGVLIRKEPKGYGTQNQLEGWPSDLTPPKTLVLVEDVNTTGGSLQKAYDAVCRQWPETKVVACISIVDRREASLRSPVITTGNVPFIALYTVEQFTA